MAPPGPARATRAVVAVAATAVLIAPASAEAGYAERTLVRGSHGRDVKLFQNYLAKSGFRTTADGRFGRGRPAATSRSSSAT